VQNALKFYVDGHWVDPIVPRTQDVIDPANERPIGAISIGSDADVELAVRAARRAFAGYARFSRRERAELLERVLVAYKRRWNDIAHALCSEVGAPISLAEGSQTGAGFHHLSATLEALKTFEFERRLGNSTVLREPIGVCGLITPWNWPLNQIAAKVAPALACGCTMVLKPSEVAPLNAIVFAEVLHEAGVPPGVFNLVNGDGPTVGLALAMHPDIDLLSFTGSTQAGIAVAKAAADTVKRVTQELGGKSPNIILDDADLETTVRRDVKIMMTNSGQSCNAPSRMLVPRQLFDRAKAIAVSAAEAIKVGDPRSPDTGMGPVVSERQWLRVQGYIQDGIREGAQLLTGGGGKPPGFEVGYYVKPTIFACDDPGATIAREEIFGPVLVMLPYDDLEQAVNIANDSPYGLSAYVSSQDVERAAGVARRLRAGDVHINGKWGTQPTPFGGFKQSGNGREGGEYGFDDYLEYKAILGRF
jgi:aldehyde dehydrogenase (NAD+)